MEKKPFFLSHCLARHFDGGLLSLFPFVVFCLCALLSLFPFLGASKVWLIFPFPFLTWDFSFI